MYHNYSSKLSKKDYYSRDDAKFEDQNILLCGVARTIAGLREIYIYLAFGTAS
jgi:hypothetical protein